MAKKINNDAENEVYRFIKILFAVIIVVTGIYFITNKYVTKEFDIKRDGRTGVVSSHNILVGSILNRPYDEYYVLAYKSTDNDSAIYDTYLNIYESKEKSLRIYVVDLDNELNKKYYQEQGDKSAKKIEDLKISSPTLIKVKANNIAKYIEGKKEIKKELGI